MIPVLIMVEGAKGTGKTSIINAAKRGLEHAGCKVLVKTWRQHDEHMSIKDRHDFYMSQAVFFDQSLNNDAEVDVVIFDGHPCIFSTITRPTVKSTKDVWGNIKKPSMAFLLSCDPLTCIKRNKNADISGHDLTKMLDAYSQLTPIELNTSHIVRVKTTNPNDFLFAAGDLRAEVLHLWRMQKGVAA